jgi:DnaK suppressor protein
MEREGHEALSEASGENNYRDHMADQGSATFERELDMTLEDNVRDALASVRGALARMDAGEYGTCARCGKTIANERLEAIPTATLCISCKSEEESP